MAINDWFVSRWMSKTFVSLKPNDRLVDAFELMRKHRIRHLPVVLDGAVVGMVSNRDVRQVMPPCEDIERGSKAYGEAMMNTPIEKIMTRKVVTTEPGCSIREAAETICAAKIGALPVLNDKKTLVGIITSDDLLWALVENTRGIEFK